MSLAQLRQANARDQLRRMRMERAVLRLLRLGPRPVMELLDEIGKARGCPDFVASRLDSYAAMDPRFVRAVGADRLPDRRPFLVP